MGIFNNVNNLQVVTDFEAQYGNQLCVDFPELTKDSINIYTDEQGKGWIKEWDDRKDSPYTSNHIVNEVMRCEEVYNKCSFTREEEFAILAHELGHIAAGKRGEKNVNGFLEEKNADMMTVHLGLASYMKSALQKMILLNLNPEKNAEMQQRIDAL